jgi:hypothetical protein
MLMFPRSISISLTNAAMLTARTWEQNTKATKPSDNLNERSPQDTLPDTDMTSSSEMEPTSQSEPMEDEPSTGDSPGSTTLKQCAVDELLTSLASRGKGSYICPYGYECKKGGLDPDGGLITFERNSSFRLVILTPRN